MIFAPVRLIPNGGGRERGWLSALIAGLLLPGGGVVSITHRCRVLFLRLGF
jgi:hypothetical protein